MRDEDKERVIKAIQFKGNNIKDLHSWAGEFSNSTFTRTTRLPYGVAKAISKVTQKTPGLLVETHEGTKKAIQGDWVIKDIKNNYDILKDDIFKTTYVKIAGRDGLYFPESGRTWFKDYGAYGYRCHQTGEVVGGEVIELLPRHFPFDLNKISLMDADTFEEYRMHAEWLWGGL